MACRVRDRFQKAKDGATLTPESSGLQWFPDSVVSARLTEYAPPQIPVVRKFCRRMTTRNDPIRILIVDDHAPLREAVRQLLESRREFEVCGEAENGEQAVVKAAELKPRVVILDIVMPGMNGFEAARKIREVSPATQIVLLSSYKDQRMLEEAKNVGAVCYVPKTDAERELIDAVKAAAGWQSSAAS